MSSSTDAGFFFSFDTDNPGEVRPPSPPQTRAEVNDLTPLSRFPWYTLSPEVVESWLSGYPQASSPPPKRPPTKKTVEEDPSEKNPVEAAAFSGRPSPLSLTLPTERGQTCTLAYQTAPELGSLVTCPPPSHLSEGESNGEGVNGDEVSRRTPERRDIIPGRYYGGLKVWSCAPDLARFVASREPHWWGSGRGISELVFAEVGCGQGLPALAAVCAGARTVILQDFNKEVLELCVKPNLAATLVENAGVCPLVRDGASGSEKELRVQLVDGDWAELGWSGPPGSPEEEGGGCDVVLGSDVTFDQEACWKLSRLLQRWLRPRTGVAFIATKVYYFGTNGGALEFAQSASRFGLTTEEVARLDEEGGMKRVILKVRKTA